MEGPMTGIEELGRTIAAAHQEHVRRRGVLGQVRGRLLAERRARSGARWRVLVPALAAAASVTVVAMLILPRLQREPLRFVVGDGRQPGAVKQWLAPRGKRALAVTFSDGSVLQLRPGAAVRIERVDEQGARVLLERGTAKIDVVPRADSSWRIDTGPFSVEVKGTRFEVSWSPTTSRFDLSLEQGHVVIKGPTLGVRSVRAGETVRVWLSKGRAELQQVKPDDEHAQTAPSAPEPHAAVSPDAGPESAPPPRAQVPRPTRQGPWEQARLGKYRQALTLADTLGWSKLLRQAEPNQLMQLGDAARLAGEPQRARQVYSALRRRFPGRPVASNAAFSLGLIAYHHGQAFVKAARWFRTYLNERPSGSLAQEAAGRLFEALFRAGMLQQAAAAAKAYLASYPRGPRATLARMAIAKSLSPRRAAPDRGL
jgi:transmembrane sensor